MNLHLETIEILINIRLEPIISTNIEPKIKFDRKNSSPDSTKCLYVVIDLKIIILISIYKILQCQSESQQKFFFFDP